MRRHGRFPHWIRVAAGIPRDEAVVVDVAGGGGEGLPSVAGFAGVIVTGSAAMVTERHDWSERSAQWLRDAVHAGMPVFGICYGHQLLAHALGGEVGDNPAGREMGTVEIALDASATDDPLFAGLPARLRAQTTHLQTVLRPPPQATVLATSEQDPCHAFRWGGHAWGVQFHPEFSTGVMRGYIQARCDALAKEGTCHRGLMDAVKPAPRARQVLRRFIHLAHRRARSGDKA